MTQAADDITLEDDVLNEALGAPKQIQAREAAPAQSQGQQQVQAVYQGNDNRLQVLKDDPYLSEFANDLKLRQDKFNE